MQSDQLQNESDVDWRRRSFDSVAEFYDTYRPSYPAPFIEQILSTTDIPNDGHILEIGSGTGKATLLFAQRGYSILCLEPGKHLATIARKNLKAFPSINFEITTFEDWDSKGRLFDLVVSAQAFHWIAPEFRYQKTARVLKPAGYLTFFWNRAPFSEALIYQKLDQVYRRYVPELVPVKTDYEKEIQSWVDELNKSGYFTKVEVKRTPWSESYSTQQYLGLLNTYSDHLRLPEEKRRQLFAGIMEVLEQEGGKIEKRYEAVAYIARKRSF